MESLPNNNSHSTGDTTASLNAKFVFSKELNAEFLEQSYSQNLEFGQKMFSIFLRTIESDLSVLNIALKTNDYTSIKDVAHKIKNNFTWVGLPRLSSLMYKIEKSASEKSVTVVEHYQNLMSNFQNDRELIEKEYERINKYLGT